MESLLLIGAGGMMFRSAVNWLALRGRLIEIAVTGQREELRLVLRPQE